MCSLNLLIPCLSFPSAGCITMAEAQPPVYFRLCGGLSAAPVPTPRRVVLLTLLIVFIYLFYDVYAYVSACIPECHPHEGQKRVLCPLDPAGVTDSCELPNVSTGNRTLVLCKSSMCPKPLSHLSSPHKSVWDGLLGLSDPLS